MARNSDFVFKLERARRHLDDLDSKVTGWLDRNFHNVTHEKHPNRPDYFIAHIVIEPIPIDPLALLVGDVLHNLRGTLDHLAYALAEKYAGSPLPDDLAKDSEFPIFRHRDENAIRKRIRGIDPAAQTIIESLQPYNRSNNTYAEDPLWILHILSNFDKHRLLLGGALAGIGGVFRHQKCRNFRPGETIVHLGYLQGKAEIVTYQGWPIDPSKEMHVEFMPFIEIVFRCGSIVDGKSVYITLDSIWKYINTRVFGLLDRFVH